MSDRETTAAIATISLRPCGHADQLLDAEANG